jgi:hypothetical protein
MTTAIQELIEEGDRLTVNLAGLENRLRIMTQGRKGRK